MKNLRKNGRGVEEKGSDMTIKDIAKESGYGIGTVSRVLNNNPNVSKKAYEKIMEVVNAHNYQPNPNARHLKMQAQKGVAIIVKGINNHLFAAILEKMQQIIEENHYLCHVSYIDQDDNELNEAGRIIEEKNPEGILFLGSNFEQYKPEEFDILTLPCVAITASSASLNIRNLSSLFIDDTAAAMYMVEHLYKQGHTKIGIIGGDPELSAPASARLMGCRMAMFHHDRQLDMEMQYAYSRYSMEGGYQAALELLDKYPDMTAVFAMSDLIAIGAIRAFRDKGKKVPEDISVTGFDGIEPAKYITPRLTTIRQNADRFAVRGVEIILYLIKNGGQAIHEIIPFEFQEGESVRSLLSE